MDISKIGGGICAPKGYMASGIHCGFRKNRDKKESVIKNAVLRQFSRRIKLREHRLR